MLEREAQKIAMKFLDGIDGIEAFAVPNEGARNRKGSLFVGVKSGWPDIGVCLPDAKIIWIENKIKGNGQQPNQIAIEATLKKIGHHYHLLTFEHEYEVTAKISGVLSAHGVKI
jgi:hypothetical protein